MKHLENQTVRDKPIYCRECNSQNSFERHPEHDVLTESGRVMSRCWKCRYCGHTTLYGTGVA